MARQIETGNKPGRPEAEEPDMSTYHEQINQAAELHDWEISGDSAWMTTYLRPHAGMDGGEEIITVWWSETGAFVSAFEATTAAGTFEAGISNFRQRPALKRDLVLGFIEG